MRKFVLGVGLIMFLLNTVQAKDGIVNYFKLFGTTNVHGETEPCG